MNYQIWRQRGDGTIQLIGQTKFMKDAETILDNWHQGYISHGGNIVRSKNMKEIVRGQST